MNLILFIIAEVERKLKFKMSLFRTKTHFKKKKVIIVLMTQL